MTQIGNLEKYFGTPEQRKARMDASIKRDMAKIDAKFEPLRKALVEAKPKLPCDMFTISTLKPKQTIGSKIVQKFVNILKMLKR